MVQELEGLYGGKIKAWVDGVPFEDRAREQASNVAALPFIFKHLAIMPDVHAAYGATVGSVIPTKGAIVPYAVGVDIGCGMSAVRTSLTASDLPDSLLRVRTEIERAIPHGGPGAKGSWAEQGRTLPTSVAKTWRQSGLEGGFKKLVDKTPSLEKAYTVMQLGSLGGGNHFVEVCLDEDDRVWVMLHSGSRGVGNLIGTKFVVEAKELMLRRDGRMPMDKDLAWLEEGEDAFDRYVEAVAWGQNFARVNREVMMIRALEALRKSGLPTFKTDKVAVNCHHNYVEQETHFGEEIFVTRKGAVSAQKGQLGIIPGSMGAKSFIVRGKGNAESFCSCSHGAGRVMSRGEAKRSITMEQHAADTTGVECRKDETVLDESPRAYKDIDAVMAAQADLVEIVHTLKQVVCVKG
jgi:tRNA-splicing ligase RtcB